MSGWTKPPEDVEGRLREMREKAEKGQKFNEPNLLHMHALLDSVERGVKFGRRYPSPAEVAAAIAATGRTPVLRQPGQDDEELA